ncbi:MAG: S49 family peptidase, partial [Acetanaerobacterium sp.]
MTGRGLAQGEVYTLADGRVYTANQALQGGLVDEIASYEDALRAIKIELGDENMPENEHLRATSAGFSTLFGSIGGLGGRNESEVILDVLSAYNKTGYYCSELAQ